MSAEPISVGKLMAELLLELEDAAEQSWMSA